MRAERKSTSHLANLVNIASGRSTIKLFICYQINYRVLHFALPMVLCMMPFHAGFPNNVIPHNIHIVLDESRCIGTLKGIT